MMMPGRKAIAVTDLYTVMRWERVFWLLFPGGWGIGVPLDFELVFPLAQCKMGSLGCKMLSRCL